MRNIRLGATIDGLVRKEKYELPPEAIREMIINAHCHRTMKVGKDTYTVKDKMSLEEVSFEESIKTEDEVGSITSTIGIKRKNDNGWTPLPVPAVEPEPIQLPQFEAPDINWGYVAAGVAVGVIIAGAIVLAPETGGASLVALAVV